MNHVFGPQIRTLIATGCLVAPLVVHAQAAVVPAAPSPKAAEVTPAAPAVERTGRELFEQTCSVCHGLDLPSRQRLDRANWEWVINDMVTLYNLNWTTEQERAKILDYLVENFGRDKPR